MRRIRFAPIAEDDLDGIFAWIGKDNPAAAERVLDRILQTVEDLAGRSTGRPGATAGTFEKLVPGYPYVVIYALDADPDDEDVLTILYVQHMARDVRP